MPTNSLDRPISSSTRLAFGLGQVAEGLKSQGFSLFALFYYNQVLGLSGTLCGLALGIALLVDAITDPLVGSLSDNFRSRWGRRHPFMVLSAAPLGLTFFGLFSPPALGETGLFLWLVGFAIATRTAMTAYHVPHISLGAELTTDFAERTRLVAARQIFGYVGALLAVSIGFAGFFADARGGRMNADAYAPFAGVLGALMIAAVLVSAWGTRREIPYLPRATREDSDTGRPSLVQEIRIAFGNASFRSLFSGVLLLYIMVGVESALALYMFEFFWELADDEFLLLSVVYPLGLIVGAFLTRALHEWLDKRLTLILGVAGWATCQVLPVALRLLELLPENETTALVATLVGFRIVQGAIVQQALVSFNSMMADIVDEHELASGRRQEGIFFGVVSFSGKSASGAGSLVAGVALDLIAWPAGSGAGAELVVPAATLRDLGIVFGPGVSIFAVVALYCFQGYRLTRERHREILRRLHDRRVDPRGERPLDGAEASPGDPGHSTSPA